MGNIRWMKAIILAAGLGTRMGSIGKTIPKCLFQIKGKPLLERQIELLTNTGIGRKDIYVVIGRQGECWSKENIEKINSLGLKVIMNPRNADFNQTYSFLLGIEATSKESMLVMDGDLIVTSNLVRQIASNKDNSTFLIQTPKSKNQVGNKIILNGNKRIIRVTRENIDIDFVSYAGMFFIAEKDWEGFKEEAKKEEYHEEDLGFVFDTLCKTREFYTFLNNTEWLNINTPEDLEQALSVING